MGGMLGQRHTDSGETESHSKKLWGCGKEQKETGPAG